MTRQEMIEIIKSFDDANFQSEIRHYMSIEDREYAYDEVCAVFDVEEACEEFLKDRSADKASAKETRATLKFARRALIAIGFYRVMPQEEIDNTWSSSGYIWNFKEKGVAYTSDETVSEWFDGAEK